MRNEKQNTRGRARSNKLSFDPTNTEYVTLRDWLFVISSLQTRRLVLTRQEDVWLQKTIIQQR